MEILDTSPTAPTIGDPTPVGFAEIGLADVVVEETLRLPVDLLDRVDTPLRNHSLDIVLTRLRAGAEQAGRPDEEPRLDRTFELPMERSFSVAGAMTGPPVTGEPAAATPCQDDLLEVDGFPLSVRVTATAAGPQFDACIPLVLGPGVHRLRSLGRCGRRPRHQPGRAVLGRRWRAWPGRAPRGDDRGRTNLVGAASTAPDTSRSRSIPSTSRSGWWSGRATAQAGRCQSTEGRLAIHRS